MEHKENIPEESAKLVLGKAKEGYKFWVKWWFFKLRFQIRPLRTSHMPMIGDEISQMEDLNLKEDAIVEMFLKSKNYRNICNCIAIAALYYPTRIFFFKRFISHIISQSEPEDVQKLFELVRNQSDYNRFFFIMASAMTLNKFGTNKKAETPGTVK